ncbi:NAD(P)-binding protein [Meira miltonrushii]|uniref:NAD(P)-binding protein n=1 Tax=Meira miltonrushii TaxID=1280837 RepID=A0A316VNU1_9BASI|nr:NAD(P)-binding protein [Meira miltonrushii]PWN37185.1 NAD(P)-binding protein [Meira miltonrushii]
MANKAIQKGELVLITGGTGWVGSHIVDKALEHGLKVRLAIRSEEKAKGLIAGLQSKYGKDAHIETTIVKDFNADDAYNEAVKGVQGIIHAASTLTFSDKWDEVIPPTVQGYRSLLKAAHKEGDAIKRVVVTSSSIALGTPNLEPGKPTQHFDVNSWNDASLEEAKVKPNSINIYAASKVLSERFTWDFVKENKPSFIVNTVNPNFVSGSNTVGTDYMSTGNMVRNVVFKADGQITEMLRSQFIVDADDVAILHVLAAMREDIVSERLLAFSGVFTWPEIFEYAQKYASDKVNLPPKSAQMDVRDNTVVDTKRTQELLKPYGGFKSVEESVRLNLQDVKTH